MPCQCGWDCKGLVDESILAEVWNRDVYGIRETRETPATIVDIGAHIGAFTVLATLLWPKARIVACEPDPDNFPLLQRNTREHPNVEVIRAAVVDDNIHEVTFHAVRDKLRLNSGGGSCIRADFWSVPIRVPAISVANLWKSRSIGQCDLLKLDCEGAEFEILRGLRRAGLLNSVRRLVGEWHVVTPPYRNGDEALDELTRILQPTHNVSVVGDTTGTEGYFRAVLE